MIWTATRRTIAGPAGEIVTLSRDGRALCLGDVIGLWRDDEAFRDFFIAMLAASPFEAFFWEMPPLDEATLARTFECAIIGSGALARMQADDADFAGHLRDADKIAVFGNLSGDALLIVPTKIAAVEGYGHIASFVRTVPRDQQHALFRRLALEIKKRLATSSGRFWVSTSGLGVPWVHVRLDRWPKYYQFKSYI